jgi:hypothetical protein
MLADIAIPFRQVGERLGIGHRAPQPGGNALFLDLLQLCGDAGFAEIFLRQHVGGDLRPELRDLDILEVKNNRTVRILDLRCRQSEINSCVG